jgi:hypothetical protein
MVPQGMKNLKKLISSILFENDWKLFGIVKNGDLGGIYNSVVSRHFATRQNYKDIDTTLYFVYFLKLFFQVILLSNCHL